MVQLSCQQIKLLRKTSCFQLCNSKFSTIYHLETSMWHPNNYVIRILGKIFGQCVLLKLKLLPPKLFWAPAFAGEKVYPTSSLIYSWHTFSAASPNSTGHSYYQFTFMISCQNQQVLKWLAIVAKYQVYFLVLKKPWFYLIMVLKFSHIGNEHRVTKYL